MNLEELKLSYTSVVMYEDVDEEGKPVWKEYQRLDTTEENRVWVEYGDICDDLVNAFVAIEDQDFWTHGGFNVKRTIYAALNEVAYALTGHYIRGTQQGASTINQQLIKNITDDDESQGTAGYLRKIREIFRAMSLNSRYSKEMIMEAYLNTLSLTGNIGGVQAGAKPVFRQGRRLQRGRHAPAYAGAVRHHCGHYKEPHAVQPLSRTRRCTWCAATRCLRTCTSRAILWMKTETRTRRSWMPPWPSR